MKIIHYFTGTDDPASNRRVLFCVLLAVMVFAGIVVFGSASTVSASTQPDAAQAGVQEQLLLEKDRLTAELAAAQEKLDALGAERDALLIRVESAAAEAAQYRQEVEVLRQADARTYVFRFRVERNVKFPEDSEVLYFTRTVDEDTYNQLQAGSVVTGSIGFITTPGDGLLHEWVVVLEDKYISINE